MRLRNMSEMNKALILSELPHYFYSEKSERTFIMYNASLSHDTARVCLGFPHITGFLRGDTHCTCICMCVHCASRNQSHL